MITPITKLTTAKQAVAVISEALECFGGAGYVEDTGLPRILADAQVLPIWEGTTNVLSLDTLRALSKDTECMQAFADEVRGCCDSAKDPGLQDAARVAVTALEAATEWLMQAMNNNEELEAGGRRFAMTLGRCLELALLCRHAQWVADNDPNPGRAAAAARRFATQKINQIQSLPRDDASLLARG